MAQQKVTAISSNITQTFPQVSLGFSYHVSVGKEPLLGKWILLSAWELITDSPASVQRGREKFEICKTGKGGKKENKKQG